MQWEQHRSFEPTILASGAETGNAFGVVLQILPPYSAVQRLHRHTAHLEACFVIEGTLALTYEEETVMLRHGELQVLQPSVGHTCWNPTATPTRLLLIYAPGPSAAELQRLADGAPDSGTGPWDTS